jgi:hypothetical protein
MRTSMKTRLAVMLALACSPSAWAEVLVPQSAIDARELGSRILQPETGGLEVSLDPMVQQGLKMSISGSVYGASGSVPFRTVIKMREPFPTTLTFNVLLIEDSGSQDCDPIHYEKMELTVRPSVTRPQVLGAVFTVEHADEPCRIHPLEKSITLHTGRN